MVRPLLMSTTEQVDVVVIGGGSGGYEAAKVCGKAGLKVVVLDGAEELGGLCILKGCMPTKAWLETTMRRRHILEAGGFGIEVGEPKVDLERVNKRCRDLVNEFQHYRIEGLKNAPFELVRANGEFVGRKTVKAGDRVFEGRRIVVATGSQHLIAPIPGIEEVNYWTSDDLLQVQEVPKSAMILGTGAVGTESAFLLNGLGCEVTIFSRSKPFMSRVGEEVSEAVVKRCEDVGINVVFCSKTEKVEEESGEVVLTFDDGEVYRAEKLVMATGRKPNLEGLNVEAAGFEADTKRLDIDEQARTKVSGIFAAGDCGSPMAVLHLAVKQGNVAGKHIVAELAGTKSEAQWEERLHMFGIFADPEIVQLGLTEKEAREAGYDPVVASYPFADQGKGMIVGEKRGVVMLMADRKSGRLLGAAGLGPGVVDHGHCVLVAIAQRMTVAQFMDVPMYHPTVAEIWSYVGEDLEEMVG